MLCFTSVIILLSQNHESNKMQRTSELICFTNEIPDANRLKNLPMMDLKPVVLGPRALYTLIH